MFTVYIGVLMTTKFGFNCWTGTTFCMIGYRVTVRFIGDVVMIFLCERANGLTDFRIVTYSLVFLGDINTGTLVWRDCGDIIIFFILSRFSSSIILIKGIFSYLLIGLGIPLKLLTDESILRGEILTPSWC